MPTSVGLVVGAFRYLERFDIVEEYLTVLVGKIEQGTIAAGMILQGRSGSHIHVLGVEAYDKGVDLKYGLLVRASHVDEGNIKPDDSIFVTQNVPIAKSRKESTFNKMALLADAINGTTLLDSPS